MNREEKRRAYQREWRKRNRDKALHYTNVWRAAHPGYKRAPLSEKAKAARRERARAWRAAHPEKMRLSHIRKRYGAEGVQLDAVRRSGRASCAICKHPASHIDHDHGTGKTRSLLCLSCNQGLGRFKDSPALLRRAAAYIERHR